MLLCRTTRVMYNSGAVCIGCLLFPASINCIVPLRGKVRTEYFGDGLVEET
jgi:hypothetical protein